MLYYVIVSACVQTICQEVYFFGTIAVCARSDMDTSPFRTGILKYPVSGDKQLLLKLNMTANPMVLGIVKFFSRR